MPTAKLTADTLTIDLVHEYFPGAFTDPVTAPLDLQLKCYRAVGCLQTEPELKRDACEHLAAVINGNGMRGTR